MAVTDFPEPDSPTSASVPPRFNENDTPSTARVVVPPWVKPTARSVTERSGSVASTSIKPVALPRLAPSSFPYLREDRHPCGAKTVRRGPARVLPDRGSLVVGARRTYL